MSTAKLSSTPRSTIKRKKDLAAQDRADLHATLDAGLVCHVGIVIDGAPRVLPTGYGRIGDTLYLHGSTGARHLREAREEPDICVTVTVLDGVVYARAAFHCAMNYRSAMIHGRPRPVTDPDEQWRALAAIAEHLAPGTWEHARRPNRRELAATAVFALDLTEASVKMRTGNASDEPSDVAESTAWAGVLLLHQYWGEPEPHSELPAGGPVPRHVRNRAAPATPR